jgi:hypothetical protein
MQVGLGHLHLRARLRGRRLDVAAFHARDDLVLLDPRPSSTPSHSSRPCAFDATAALRCGTTYPVALSSV